MDVQTTKDAFKLYTSENCEKKLYETSKENFNKSEYKKSIKDIISRNKNSRWPYTGKLQLQFSVSNIKSKLEECDIDNLAKTLLDSFEGLIYTNDKQIICLAASKEYVFGVKAVIVAVKHLENDERSYFKDFLYSSNSESWKEESDLKAQEGKTTGFRQYNIAPISRVE